MSQNPETITLKNDFITVKIKSFGAELFSLKLTNASKEFLWQANPDYWPRRAPILFPVVGRLKNNQYQLNGNTFPLGQHGFARESEFEITHHTTNSATFTLIQTPEHQQSFAFNYSFSVVYSIVNNQLKQEFLCTNHGNDPMFFSCGGHPAFNCNPIEQHHLTFEPPLNHPLFVLEEGCIRDIPKSQFQGNTLLLDSQTFLADALIFERISQQKINLWQGELKMLTVNTENMPSLGIWSKPGAPFVCIEPWDGLADFESHTGDLATKRGIQKLLPGENYRKGFTIELF